MLPNYSDPDELRTRFTLALSEMYRKEVPQYGTLIQLVHEVDRTVLAAQGRTPESLPARHELERHGAIRLGTGYEMGTIRRLFSILGMQAVGYYDLRIVGFPLHATAFRPISEESLSKNPFRVFTTVLRKELLSPEIRVMAERILEKRRLFTPRLLDIISRVEGGQQLTRQDAADLLTDALEIFKWHSRSSVAYDEYLKLEEAHPMVADIVCFPSAHINHLTPRTLNIELVQKEMIKRGLRAKDRIEGPPVRQCPILLRQTSFKALEERVEFVASDGRSIQGAHTARFGEVEQRGAAVTRKGRELYDKLLSDVSQNATNPTRSTPNAGSFDDILSDTFARDYPDTWAELQAQSLVYFRYQVTSAGHEFLSKKSKGRPSRMNLQSVLSLGLVESEPITYEDFLPFSAAGIFKSNLKEDNAYQLVSEHESSLPELESVLGCKVLDEFELYSKLQLESIKACEKALGLEEILVTT